MARMISEPKWPPPRDDGRQARAYAAALGLPFPRPGDAGMEILAVDRGAVQSAVEDVGLDFEDALVEGYRGRGMDSETWGLRFENEVEIDEFFAEMSAFDHDVGLALVRQARRDSLGRRYLVYFPGIELKLL